MALTLSLIRQAQVGPLRIRVHDVDFDDSYPTGGEALTAASLGLHEVYAVLPESKAGYVFRYDRANAKLLAYRGPGHTPEGTLSKPTFTVEASGAIGANMEVGFSADSAAATFEGGTGITAQRVLTTTSPVGTPTFTGTAVAASVLVEVGNTVDLSSVTDV